MGNADENAVAVAEKVDQSLKPDMTVLFGSRARGDYRPDSDIDVLLVRRRPPTAKDIEKAQEQALEVYGRRVAVQLVWRSPEEFRGGRRYWNSIETRALREGLKMRRDSGGYGSLEELDPEDAETERDWRRYQKFLLDATTELDDFLCMVDGKRSDRSIGRHAQGAVENAMNALLEAWGERPGTNHQIGEMLGRIRERDPEIQHFSLQICPDVYSGYDGRKFYQLEKREPGITEFEGYREKTVADVERLLKRAEEVREQQEVSTPTENNPLPPTFA